VGSPYQNQAIISVIKYELFCVKSIVRRYPKQFADKKEVTPPVLAFAATAVHQENLGLAYALWELKMSFLP
jgi:hypothetical protein